MKTSIKIPFFVWLVLLISCNGNRGNMEKTEEIEQAIVRLDRPDASILRGVHIPEGKSYFYTSGLVAPLKDETAEPGTYKQFGDTYEQSIGTLERIKETIGEAGYEMSDVFFLRVYLAPDKSGNIDWNAWFRAYAEYFNNEENPHKVARSTIGVHALANPELLIEIEAVAAK